MANVIKILLSCAFMGTINIFPKTHKNCTANYVLCFLNQKTNIHVNFHCIVGCIFNSVGLIITREIRSIFKIWFACKNKWKIEVCTDSIVFPKHSYFTVLNNLYVDIYSTGEKYVSFHELSC
jgi:hypothetical protein